MRLRYCDMMNFLPRSSQSRRRWRRWSGKAETNMFRNRNHLGALGPWYSAFLEMHHLLLVRGLVSKADSYPRSARTMACHAAFVAVFRAVVSACHRFPKLSQTNLKFALNPWTCHILSPPWSSHEEWVCIYIYSTQDVLKRSIARPIFSSDDIQKQLPNEAKRFEQAKRQNSPVAHERKWKECFHIIYISLDMLLMLVVLARRVFCGSCRKWKQ